MSKLGFFRAVDGSFIDGENDILSKCELMHMLGISRSSVQRYMRQGLPYVPFDNNTTGFNLLEVQAWLEKNKALPPDYLRKRWQEHSKTFKKDRNDKKG